MARSNATDVLLALVHNHVHQLHPERLRALVVRQVDLVVGDDVPLLDVALALLRDELVTNGNRVAGLVRLYRGIGNRNGLLPARTDARYVYRPRGNGLAVHENRLLRIETVEPPEELLVANGRELAGRISRHAHGLIDVLDLPVRRLEGAVGEDAAVHHELTVRRRVAEVAAVGDDQPVPSSPFPIPSSPFPIPLLIQALVHPVPDAAADDYVGTLEGVLIVLQVAHRVHHVVRVFAEEVRTLRIHVSSAAADAVNRRIHVGVDVGGRPVALVVRGTRPVAFVYRLVGRLEVLAGTRFVAVAPEEDGRMVLVALDHVHVAPHCREREARVVARRALPVSHAVRLHVRLVHERDAVQVAKVVPVVVLRIVRVAHERAVRALQELHVLLLALVRTVVPEHRIRLVAVRAAELHLLAVEAVAPVDDLALAEPEQSRNAFKRLAVLDERKD